MVIRQSLPRVSQTVAFVALAAVSASATDIWHVSIDEGPAPPPQDGPPFSAGATRDPSFLKYEVIAIVGSYLATVVILGTALLTVGRKWRKQAQRSTSSRAMEMVKPSAKWQKPSPISPAESSRSWRKWTTKEKARQSSLSLATIDAKVVEADKMRRQDEMERLYAAVLAENAKNNPDEEYEGQPQRPEEFQHLEDQTYHEDTQDMEPPGVVTREVDPVTGQVLSHTRSLSGSSRSFSQRRPPPRLDTSTPVTGPGQNPSTTTSAWTGSTATATSSNMQSPEFPQPIHRNTPKSPVRAIYPPSRSLPQDYENPISPGISNFARPEQRSISPPTQQPYNQPPTSHPISHGLPTSPRSPPQKPRSSGSTSRSRSKPRSVKNLTISAPIQQNRYQYDGNDEAEIEARRPLSPPSPQSHSLRTTPDNSYSNNRTPVQDGDYVHEEDIIDAYGYEGLDQRRPVPLPAPHRSEQSDQLQASRSNPTKGPPPGMPTSPHYIAPLQTNHTRPPPIPPTITIQPYSADSSSHSLPLRSPKSKLSTASPGPTKTTFLSPRKENFGSSALPGGFAPVQTPRTQAAVGKPMKSPVGTVGTPTPYSPYMPRTPMTPVTPGLMSPRERRERKRGAARTVPVEDDAVAEPSDMWGDGWD